MCMSGNESVNEAREWRERRIRARSTWAFEIVWLLSCRALYSMCGQQQTVFVECRQVKPIKTQKRHFNWHLVLNILHSVWCKLWIELNCIVAFLNMNCKFSLYISLSVYWTNETSVSSHPHFFVRHVSFLFSSSSASSGIIPITPESCCAFTCKGPN